MMILLFLAENLCKFFKESIQIIIIYKYIIFNKIIIISLFFTKKFLVLFIIKLLTKNNFISKY